MNKYIIIACIAMTISGCAQDIPTPVVRTVTVDKPVLMSCIPDNYSTTNTFVDTDSALISAHGIYNRYKLLIAGRQQRASKINEYSALINGCEKSDYNHTN